MSAVPIPESVRRFILLSVPSVPYLEAMLLLRALGRQAITVTEVSRRLYLPEARAAELVAQLVDMRVVTPNREGTWRYEPDPELAARIDELAQAYSTNLIGVAELIHSKSERRAAQFADAFKIRREP
jgi:DNA-binding IclR family transcriptional regulator